MISISPKEIKNQIIYSAKDIKPDAIKIGMLNSKLVIKKVIESLKIIKIKKDYFRSSYDCKGWCEIN